MADAPELQRLLQAKHEAVRTFREAVDDAAKQQAWDGIHAASEALEAELVAREEAREADERMAAIEARENAAKLVTGVKAIETPRGNLPMDELRAFAEKKVNNVSFTIPYGESRTDIIDETGNSGAHYVVPETMADRVVIEQKAQSGVLQAGPTILRTADAQVLRIPTLTAANDATAAKTAQGAASTVTNPVFTQADLTAFRIDGHMLVADELFRDSGVNMNTLLGTLACRALGAKLADYLADFEIGTGSTLPNAITLGSTASTATASNTTVTMDELRALYFGRLPQYRRVGSWVVLTDVLTMIGSMKDDTGNYIWVPSAIASEPDKLWGRPIYDDAYMSSMATANRVAVFGDISGYWVRFSGGLEVSFSRDFEFTSFSTTCRFAIWVDSVVADAAAIAYLLLAT
jgi:HK97 family phage major capsid protein